MTNSTERDGKILQVLNDLYGKAIFHLNNQFQKDDVNSALSALKSLIPETMSAPEIENTLYHYHDEHADLQYEVFNDADRDIPQIAKALTIAKPQVMDLDKVYPCADCGKLRSKDEGGTVFTVCDKCWEKKYKTKQKDCLPDLSKEECVHNFDCTQKDHDNMTTAKLAEHLGIELWKVMEIARWGQARKIILPVKQEVIMDSGKPLACEYNDKAMAYNQAIDDCRKALEGYKHE